VAVFFAVDPVSFVDQAAFSDVQNTVAICLTILDLTAVELTIFKVDFALARCDILLEVALI